ncbi:site-specific integrase, partial [Patescibacteria group bacterium]|nr:site-specific integrase [Patescibacteria group bacterium]
MEIKTIVKSFRLWLHSRQYSSSTILNYISDTKKYLRWLKKQPQHKQSHRSPSKFFSPNLLASYISHLSNKKSNTRYLASLSLFCQFAVNQNIVSTNPYKKAIKLIKQNKRQRSHLQGEANLNNISSLLNHYKTYLITTKKSPVTIRNYLADIRQFISHSNTNSPKTLFDSTQTDNYLKYLKNSQLSPSSTRRKLSSISSFQKFLIKKKYLETPVIASPPIKSGDVATCPEPNRRIPSKLKKPPLFAFTHLFNKYLLITSILIIISSLAYGLYYQTILKSKQQLAYSTIASPATPTRQLSFQGRLTDNSDNPVTSPVGIQFKLFNSGAGGTELYDSGVGGTATPDTNGIFSVIIGKNIGDTIPASVFSENTEVWLEIIMDPSGTPEIMDPRQQIATVAYAMNAETLQGIPPSASGLKDTVMVIDGSGNINLGETSPSIISNSSGTFGLEGQAMLIKATDGSGGNITINPDASGIIQFLTEGTTPSVGGFINATNANLTSGNLFNGQINNTNRGYNFLEFQNYDIGTTSLSSRFSVDAYGNTNIGATLSTINISIGNTLVTSTANELNLLDGTTATNGSLIYGNGSNLTNLNIGASAYVLQSTGSLPIWVPADSAGIGSTITAGSGLTKLGSQIKLGGALTENTRLNIGSTEAFFIDYSTGNIGMGTTNPTQLLEIGTDGEANRRIRINSDTSNSYLLLTAGGNQNNFESYGDVHTRFVSHGYSYMSFETNESTRLRIHASGGMAIGNCYYSTDPGVNRLIIEGNVGIGTTSPLTKLHIEGQCVTGDSLLPIVKKDSNHQKTTPNVVASGKPTDLPVNESDKLESSITNKNSLSSIKKDVEIGRIEPPRRSLSDSQGKPAIPTSTNNISQEIEYKKIKDIKGGEMVLSLDETTGKIIPSTINGLLDMGVKPIYQLTTQDGKSIKTTGNHPYLVKNSLSDSGNQIPNDETANYCQQDNNNLKNDNNIHNLLLSSFSPPTKINNQSAKQSNKPANNQKKISGNNPILLSNNHLVSSSKSNAILTHQIAKNEDSITINSLTNKGTVVATPNPPNTNPLAKSKKKSANPFDCPRFKDNSINQTLSKDKKLVNKVWPAMSNT